MDSYIHLVTAVDTIGNRKLKDFGRENLLFCFECLLRGLLTTTTTHSSPKGASSGEKLLKSWLENLVRFSRGLCSTYGKRSLLACLTRFLFSAPLDAAVQTPARRRITAFCCMLWLMLALFLIRPIFASPSGEQTEQVFCCSFCFFLGRRQSLPGGLCGGRKEPPVIDACSTSCDSAALKISFLR